MPPLDKTIPGLYRWRAQDIPEPEPKDEPSDAEVPLPTQHLIRDAMTHLLENIGQDFHMAPHALGTSRDADSEPDQIDHEVRRIRSLMLAIQRDLGRRVAHLCKRRNAAAPFNRLPPELVGIILSHIIPQPPASPNKQVRSARYDAFNTLRTVAKISTGWWHVIKLCPVLWTTVASGPAKSTAFQLRHSGNLPLSIVHLYGHTSNASYFLDQVLAHSARWKLGFLQLDTPKELDHIRERLRGSMPHLERLEIQCIKNQDERIPLDLPASSVLRCIEVLGVPLNPATPALRFVQYLTLGSTRHVPIAHILRTLAATVALKSFTLASSVLEAGDEDVVTRQQPIVQLPYLTSLSIFNVKPPYLIALLDGIHADNLSSLRAKAAEDHEDDSLALQRLIHSKNGCSFLGNVIARSAPPLIEMWVEHDNLIEISGPLSGADEEESPSPISIKLFHEEWFSYLEALEPLPTFGAKLPPVHLRLSNVIGALPRNFLLAMPTITLLDLEPDEYMVAPQFWNVLTHPYAVNGDLVWACPNLTDIRFRLAEMDDFDTVLPFLLEALREWEQADRAGKLPKITVFKEEADLALEEYVYVAVN